MQAPDKHGVVAHTENPRRYYKPGQSRLNPMGNRTMISRSNKDGAPLGYVKGAGQINIDPGNIETGDGGVAVDLSHVDADTSAWAWAQACRMTDDHNERVELAYKLLNAPPEETDEYINPVMPQAYVVPKSTITGAQVKKKAKIKMKKPIKRVEPKPEPEAPEIDLEELANLLAAKMRPPAPKKKRPLVPKAEKFMDKALPAKETPTKGPEMFSKQQAVEAIKQGFASLGIPGLGPEPTKPKFKVQFDLGNMGKQIAHFHWVSEDNGGLFLIYDTRFEFGSQYTPPNLGSQTPIKVRLPDQGKEYTVYSTDFVHSFGVFTIINLVIVDHAAQETVLPGGPPTIGDLKTFMLGETNGEDWGD